MEPYAVCIPTYNRYDILEQTLAAIKASVESPSAIYVLDNGGAFPGFAGVEVIRPRRNLGVAASWNLLIKIASPLKPVILNDDLIPAPPVCRDLASSRAGISTLENEGMSAFSLEIDCYNQVGPFDETFWPAYFEDIDYMWRIHLAGQSREIIQGACQHNRSSTRKKMTLAEDRALVESCLRSGEYYQRKWGGPPNQEEYASPFTKATRQCDIQLVENARSRRNSFPG